VGIVIFVPESVTMLVPKPEVVDLDKVTLELAPDDAEQNSAEEQRLQEMLRNGDKPLDPSPPASAGH